MSWGVGGEALVRPGPPHVKGAAVAAGPAAPAPLPQIHTI